MTKITDIERMFFLAEKQRDVWRENPKIQQLVDILLKNDGQFVVLPRIEEDLNALIKRGTFYGKPIKHIKGEPCHCHSNVSRLFEKDICQIVTGYAMPTDDPAWRQHTWGFDVNNHILYETTSNYKKYFGVLLSEKEARKFARENW